MERSSNIALLESFMRGETSSQEEQLLANWLHSPEAKEELLDYYQETWNNSGNDLAAEVQRRMYERIKSQMHTIPQLNQQKTKKRFPLRRVLQYAAVVLLVIMAGVGGHLYTTVQVKDTEHNNSKYLVQTDKGQRANITLPDGTVVWLNSYTQLQYNADYGTTKRIVTLTGEAYFEVAKNKDKPFIVKTEGVDVEALGTTFNIKAYQEDPRIVATLFSGAVRIASNENNVILSPDENATYDRNSGRLVINQLENSSYAKMWRDNELVFNGETLDEIAVLLNRMYNVQIIFKSERIKKYCFSGVICNNSLDNVIELISLTSPITYETRGDTIVLGNR